MKRTDVSMVMRLAVVAACCGWAASFAPSSAVARTTWLCRPGTLVNPCQTDTAARSFDAAGKTMQVPALATRSSRTKVDCFYVYPTISGAPMVNAPAVVTPQLRSLATLQASRFSSLCRVYSPLYRQLTLKTRRDLPVARQRSAVKVAYADVLAAWKEYLRRDNRGRGVIFIGHSQGTGMLRRLIAQQVDDSAAQRKRLVAAYLLGGDVTVRNGSDTGGDFKHVPACRTSTQVGCVVAYSSFAHVPPNPATFGRLPSEVRAVFGGPNTAAGFHVLCTDPARLAASSGRLDPSFPSDSSTLPWATYPDRYTGACRSSRGASWLQITATGGSSDTRPVVGEPLGPTWGNHLFDINVAYGQLLTIASRQAAAYSTKSAR